MFNFIQSAVLIVVLNIARAMKIMHSKLTSTQYHASIGYSHVYAFKLISLTQLLKNPIGALDLLLRWLAHLVLHCTDEAQLSRNSCLQLHFWHQLLKFHVITGSGALCFGDLIIPANSLTASWVWVLRPGCFAVLVGGLSNPIEP